MKEFLKESDVPAEVTEERRSRRRSSIHSTNSVSSRASSKKEVTSLQDETPTEVKEEDWNINEDDLKIPQTVLFKNLSSNGVDLGEEETVDFFKSIDLNNEEIEKL